VLVSRVVEGSFPNIADAIPQNCPRRVTVNRQEFMEALARVDLSLDDLTAAEIAKATRINATARLTLGADSLVIVTEAADRRGEETIDAEGDGGPALDIGMQPKFLIDALRSLQSDRVTFEGTDAAGAWRFVEGGQTHAVMPVSLS